MVRLKSGESVEIVKSAKIVGNKLHVSSEFYIKPGNIVLKYVVVKKTKLTTH